MNIWRPSFFFDLTGCEHRELFDETFPVWEAIRKISKYLENFDLGAIEGEVDSGAYLINRDQISIGKGSVVEAGAYILGPCIIGENCEIRHGAYLRENVVIGNHCVIGHASEVKNSIFLPGAHAGHFAYVGDSILGKKTNLGAGTKCANLRFDRKPIHIYFENKRIETEMRKLGVIMGDESQTGCNSVTNPGTLMGKNTILGPCEVAKGFINCIAPALQLK